MENKNIVIVIRDLKIGGGAERQASVLGNELKVRGYNVSFLVFAEAREKFEIQAPYFCLPEIKIKNSFDAFWAIFKRAKKIKEFCREKKIDCAISFMEEANLASLFSKIIFKNKAKIILSIRANPVFKKFVAKLFIKFLYNKADKIVVNSSEVKFILEKRFNFKKVNFIRNSFDFEKIEELEKVKINEKLKNFFIDKPIFINIGRLEKEKRHKILIKSFKKVVAFNKNARLIIVGEGSLENKLTNVIKKFDLHNNIFILKNQNNIFSLLKESDCFVFSSLFEGSPNSLVEALIVGLPVISSNCSGVKELLIPGLGSEKDMKYPFYSERGVLVDVSENEDGLAEEMIKFIKNNNFNKRRHVLDEFKLGCVINEWEKLINNF